MIYKKALQENLRFETTKGLLTVEQLFDLSMTALGRVVRNLNKQRRKDNDDELSFLDETSTSDPTLELKFEIVKDIYQTKKQEREDLKNARSKKEHNDKILSLIAKKKEQDLENLPIEELEKQLLD